MREAGRDADAAACLASVAAALSPDAPFVLELELFSSEEKSRLRRKIRRDLRDLEIEVATQSVSGNRMVFINPNAE